MCQQKKFPPQLWNPALGKILKQGLEDLGTATFPEFYDSKKKKKGGASLLDISESSKIFPLSRISINFLLDGLLHARTIYDSWDTIHVETGVDTCRTCNFAQSDRKQKVQNHIFQRTVTHPPPHFHVIFCGRKNLGWETRSKLIGCG